MRPKSAHELNDIMIKTEFCSKDGNDLTYSPQQYNPSGNFMSETKSSSLSASRRGVNREGRGKDTLVPSRRLIALVNNDPTFIEAQRHLGLFPQVAYKLVRDGGVTRAKQVTDFILSLALETPYFQVDKYGQYDPSLEGQRDRARKMLINMALTNKPILEKYAGPSYFKKWPKGA